MKTEEFLLDIISKIEARYDCIAYAYKQLTVDGEFQFYWISIDNHEVYFHDPKFKVLRNAWNVLAAKRGTKITFCYSAVLEKKLEKLLQNNNLIMNV